MQTHASSTQGRLWLLVVVLVSIGWACGSNPTGPSSAASPASAPEGPAIPFRVFGVVTNDDGLLLGGAIVTLTYQPEFAATQSVNTRTGADGRYELQLNAKQPGNVSAVVRAISGTEYSPAEQFVRVADSAEKNLRLRPIQIITVGQSATLRFDSDSSVCSSVGIGGLCEWLRIQPPTEFRYKLDVKATGEGDVVPTLVAALGSYQVVGQPLISIQVGSDDFGYSSRTIDVAVSIPYGTAPQQYEVTVH